jgi:hypothetical protein
MAGRKRGTQQPKRRIRVIVERRDVPDAHALAQALLYMAQHEAGLAPDELPDDEPDTDEEASDEAF